MNKEISQMLNEFFSANRTICNKIELNLPQAQLNIFDLYEKLVAEYINRKNNQTIVDVGGGRTCPFAKYKSSNITAKIIGVDISEDELKNNNDLDEKRIADITRKLPFGNEEADIITSRSVLEHLKNLENFISESDRILKKGGYFIHLLPSKFAFFAIINQLIPKKISKMLLYHLLPENRGISGFPAFYNKCFYSAIKTLLLKYDFEIVDIHLSYYQSAYFKFFLPFFLISAVLEICLYALKLKKLSAYILVIARKK